MSEITSNKTILSNLPGGFAIMPNALIGFISDKACAVFLKIYQCQFVLDKITLDGEEWVQVSGPYLTTAMRKKNRNAINDAINELVGLNIIKSKTLNRKQVLYCINWEEIVFACKVLCAISFEGRDELLKTCVRDEIIPISQVSDEVRDEIIRTYPNKRFSYENVTNQPMFVTKSYEHDEVRDEIIRTNDDSYENDTNMSDSIETEQQSSDDCFLDDDETNVRDEIIRKNRDSYRNHTNIGEIRNEIIHNIYIEEKEKKKLSERSSQYRDNKDKELLDYFSTRDLSLPVFDQTFYEFFLEQDIDDADDDVIKSIKTVWGQLGYDDELSAENFIDLRTFKNILYHSWAQLKEDYPDYSLSEEDMKNIFGFLIMEHEGEDCLYIDPSKLRDLSTPVSRPVKEKSTRNFQFTDRTSRRLFLDCVNEVADEDEQLLTSSEFVALLLIDYANDHASGPFSIELPKLAYEDLLKDFSENSHVPVEDIRTLFKDLPQRHKITLSPQQLIPDRFFQYNDAHKEQSKVKELLLKRLEEEE